VGEFVPVFRVNHQRWSFGQVSIFDNKKQSNPFCVLFGTLGSDQEWLDIDPHPFAAYLRYHRQDVPTANLIAETSATRHDSPWYKTPRSWDAGMAARGSFAFQPYGLTPTPCWPYSHAPNWVGWAVPANFHRHHNIVSPGSQAPGHQRCDTRYSSRLWSIDVRCSKLLFDPIPECSSHNLLRCLVESGRPALDSSNSTNQGSISMVQHCRAGPSTQRETVPRAIFQPFKASFE
jgi:hypothetical protein